MILTWKENTFISYPFSG